jgi:3',5'-cyclic AMP phosphodiesterase CpdA
MTIAHFSDPHFGRIAHPGIVDALIEEVNTPDVDLVAISGDLTQRARRSEFARARTMLNAIEAPVLVVPGNHDVFPWWMPWRRLSRPLGRYRSLISQDLTPSFTQNGVAVLGLSSAHGATIKGGRLTAQSLAALEAFFDDRDGDTFKVVVLHHHLTKIRALGHHDIVRSAQDALDTAIDAGVDLILCGHLHISHIEPVEIVPGEHRLVIASAGTATSNRGRKWHRKTNFYNRIRVAPESFAIEERRYLPETGAFVRDSVTTFDRTPVPSEETSSASS